MKLRIWTTTPTGVVCTVPCVSEGKGHDSDFDRWVSGTHMWRGHVAEFGAATVRLDQAMDYHITGVSPAWWFCDCQSPVPERRDKT